MSIGTLDEKKICDLTVRELKEIILDVIEDVDQFTPEFEAEIEHGLEDLKSSNTIPHEEVLKEYGLSCPATVRSDFDKMVRACL
ncbi:MAG: hypothetical protein HQL03_08465 [Nitrospirae bacterium]|nr:hypothetical protein [Nitrospirota bacterium]MBF0592141.1 hypothetical protein [Nitrospirota bacterium]